MQYCFHHIPKTAGSSLQLRLAHRESLGQLPKGSTLVVYPLYDKMSFYRVSDDPNFNPDEPIKTAFLRTYEKPERKDGNATIVCGHYTNITQPGEHYVWLRHPLHRDISHFNYDTNSIIGMSGEGQNTNPEMYIGKKRGEELVCVIIDSHRVHILEHCR